MDLGTSSASSSICVLCPPRTAVLRRRRSCGGPTTVLRGRRSSPDGLLRRALGTTDDVQSSADGDPSRMGLLRRAVSARTPRSVERQTTNSPPRTTILPGWGSCGGLVGDIGGSEGRAARTEGGNQLQQLQESAADDSTGVGDPAPAAPGRPSSTNGKSTKTKKSYKSGRKVHIYKITKKSGVWWAGEGAFLVLFCCFGAS